MGVYSPPPISILATNLRSPHLRVQPKTIGPAAATVQPAALLAILVGVANLSGPEVKRIRPVSQSSLLGPSWPGISASSNARVCQQGSSEARVAMGMLCGHQNMLFRARNVSCVQHISGVLPSASSGAVAWARPLHEFYHPARCGVVCPCERNFNFAIFVIPALSQDSNPIPARPANITSSAVTAAARRGRCGISSQPGTQSHHARTILSCPKTSASPLRAVSEVAATAFRCGPDGESGCTERI